MKYTLAIANLIIPVASFYLFGILNHHGPSGDETVAILLYVVGFVVAVLDLLFIFKKRENGAKKVSVLNIIFLLLVIDHVVINLPMFVLVLALFQL